jgi:hypothetical protein
MQNLSVLIFSRNDTEKAVDLAVDLYDVASEIVLVDSSDKEHKKLLDRQKYRLGMTNLRIFNAVALGYPDPLRMYALSKCRFEWVLLIDTDERISPDLKDNIKEIISNANCSAFAIKRYEEVKGRKLPRLFTWQIRLFKRKQILFHGNLHEQPEVNGKLRRIEEPTYYMAHMLELMEHTRHGNREYRQMRKFDRFTYREYNRRVAVGSSRLSMSGRSENMPFPVKALKAYQTITFRDPDSEVSLFDYGAYYLMLEMVFALKGRSLSDMLGAWSRSRGYVRQYKEWLRSPDSAEIFAIAQKINKVGVIQFLGLDKPAVVDAINRKYARSEQGIKLLEKLLKNKYEGKPL